MTTTTTPALHPAPQAFATKGIDLRSDTVTLPSEPMRRAMYEAELGDDVFGDDPTINALERRAAELTGKEAALFVTSGTQGNLTAILSQCQRGDEIIVGDQAHIFFYEVGGASALGGVQMRTIPNQSNGDLDRQALRAAIRGDNIHFPKTALICLENTQNRCGGAVLSLAQMNEVRAIADAARVPVHLDGARIFNAAIALGLPLATLVAPVDTVTFCLSKGLGAPAGSLLCGEAELIGRARKWRKMLGGGMRQAGVLAAAGLFALDQMVDRLADDHANARLLAEGLAQVRGISVDVSRVATNIVVADICGTGRSTEAILNNLDQAGVRATGFGGTLVRFTTHFGIERADIEAALGIIRHVVEA